MVTGLETMFDPTQPYSMTLSIDLIRPGTTHPFRRSLPWHFHLRGRLVKRVRQIVTADNVRDFLLAYCACFVAVSLFVW